MRKLAAERSKLLDLQTDLSLKKQKLSPADELELRQKDFETDLAGLEQVLRRYEAQPWKKQTKEEQRLLEKNRLFRLISYAAQNVLVWARNDRFEGVGQLWPALPKVFLDDLNLITTDVNKAQQEAVKAALANRVDLMNARAQVVDAWRQLRVTANALLGVFNVQYHLDSTTPQGATRPFAFSTSATHSQLSLNAQLAPGPQGRTQCLPDRPNRIPAHGAI